MTASNGSGGTPAIELCNLHRHFGRLRAVDGVSFQAYPGQVMGFIGPNGAGKTTLLKILSRITRPTTGWAEIRGRVRSLLEVGTGVDLYRDVL